MREGLGIAVSVPIFAYGLYVAYSTHDNAGVFSLPVVASLIASVFIRYLITATGIVLRATGILLATFMILWVVVRVLHFMWTHAI